MAPSGDMPTAHAQLESFSLANMVPQAPQLNRRSWADLEKDVRELALDTNSVYVVTGSLYAGTNIQFLHDRVAVPTSVYKAVAVPGRGAVVEIATNENRPSWQSITVAEFSRSTGINPFPALSSADAQRKLTL